MQKTWNLQLGWADIDCQVASIFYMQRLLHHFCHLYSQNDFCGAQNFNSLQVPIITISPCKIIDKFFEFEFVFNIESNFQTLLLLAKHYTSDPSYVF